MSRKLTRYRQPSLGTRIAAAPDILALAALRDVLLAALSDGRLQAAPGTLRDWERAVWVRVVHFIAAAPTAEAVSLVFNATLTWTKPEPLAVALEKLVRDRCAALGSPVGIATEGVPS